MTHPHRPFYPALSPLLALTLVVLITACSIPHSKPFQEFSKATTGTGSATHHALGETSSRTRDGLIDSVTDLAAFNGLKLDFSPGDYTWSYPDPRSLSRPPIVAEPDASTGPPNALISTESVPERTTQNNPWMDYHYRPQLAAAEIAAYNRAFSQYSQLLADLAAKHPLTEAEFKKRATELNQQTTALGRRAGITAPSETAILSTAATALFNQYLHSRQRGLLRRSIEANQDAVRQYAALGTRLTLLLATPVWQTYHHAFDRHKEEFENAKTDASRRRAVAAAVSLNDATITHWTLFAEMNRLYAGIPGAHRSLARAVEGREGPAALADMAESSARLHRIYQDLKTTNEKSARKAADTQPES